jgi:hypothetical protein
MTFAPPSRAGGPIGANGTPIQTSEYAIDLYSGPVFAGSRMTGLAGAYIAISEDVDGNLQNPATPAVRPFFSYNDFDYWLGFGLTFPATLQNADFFNSGSKTNLANSPDSFVFLTPALNLQWGELGIGANVELQHYALSKPATATTGRGSAISATIPITHVQVAHGFDHNQWVFGVGARFASISVITPHEKQATFTSSGTGLEFGGLYKPENIPLRVGAAIRTGIRTQAAYQDTLLPNDNGDLVLTTDTGSQVFLPKAVALPWDVNFGFAVQFGPRPMNPPWRTSSELIERQTLVFRIRQIDREKARGEARTKPRDERRAIEEQLDMEQRADDAALDRELEKTRLSIEADLTKMNQFYFQVSTALLVSGSVEEAVGVESLVAQVVNRSGQNAVVSPRLGLESGGFLSFLRVRGGSYIEPTRFEGSTARIHGTFGVDIKLVRWNVFGAWPDDYLWRLGLGADAARDYATWGITIAGWYPRHSDPGELKAAAPSLAGSPLATPPSVIPP